MYYNLFKYTSSDLNFCDPLVIEKIIIYRLNYILYLLHIKIFILSKYMKFSNINNSNFTIYKYNITFKINSFFYTIYIKENNNNH